MATWVKWWKDNTFIKICIVALITMIIGFLLAYFIDWGWIVTIILSCTGGFVIRKIITNRLDKEAEKTEKNSNSLNLYKQRD